MTVLRNLLITYGAVVASSHFVRILAVAALRPQPWTGEGTETALVGWWLGAACLAGALSGIFTGLAVQAERATGWALLLGVLGAFESGGRVDWRSFSSVVAFGRVNLVVSLSAACVAVLCLFGARAWSSHRSAA